MAPLQLLCNSFGTLGRTSGLEEVWGAKSEKKIEKCPPVLFRASSSDQRVLYSHEGHFHYFALVGVAVYFKSRLRIATRSKCPLQLLCNSFGTPSRTSDLEGVWGAENEKSRKVTPCSFQSFFLRSKSARLPRRPFSSFCPRGSIGIF